MALSLTKTQLLSGKYAFLAAVARIKTTLTL